ncbi:MAG TPA: hypothetical protein VHM70_28710 [Polyangiaceae bacterium]|jgi:hypothetical protein|nr:hypothetical protein [Polyangiaceae bacterium]
MLIECNNCGAPLAIKSNPASGTALGNGAFGNGGIVKCAYCNATSQVAQARTVAPATPPDWQPPRQWRPPPGYQVSPDQVFTYRTPLRVLRAVLTSVFLVAMIMAMAAFVVVRQAAVVAPSGAAAMASALLANGLAQGALAQAQQAIADATKGALAKKGSQNYFAAGGAEVALAKFKAALGSRQLTIRQLVLYPNYAILEAQDPQNPKHWNRYTLMDDLVGTPEPISNDSVAGENKKFFDPDSVALSQLSTLIPRTVSTLGFEGGQVSHVIVQSNLPFSKQVVMRVYVHGPRDDGRIDYTAQGKQLEVH